jgi:uncharacterized GH25 family protein
MFRYATACIVLFAIATSSNAHFVFVTPDARNPEKALVVFSDELAPDRNVDIAKIAGIKLQMRDAAGKDSPLTATRDANALAVNVPGKGRRIVFGSIDYGVLQRGDDKPFMLRYHPKAILGATDSSKIGEKLPVEVVAILANGKVRFQVLAKGKPLADAEVNVIMAGDKKEKLMTDKEGLTTAIEAKGKMGVWTKASTNASGEIDGKKYEEIRDYATLVIDCDAK